MKTLVSSANSNKNTNGNTTAATGAVAAGAAVSAAIIPKTEVTEQQQFQAPTTINNITTGAGGVAGNTKRPASLDLNKLTPAKKQRLVGPSPLLMDMSDLQNGKALNTPDVEKIILASNLLQTPQPGLIFPTKVGGVTREQEDFGKGFEEVLNNLHHSKNNQANLNVSAGSTASVSGNNSNSTTATTTSTTSTGMSGGSFTYTNLETLPVAIKDEPQNGPASPPVSPIDMETQEKIKLERKRQRNRVAASKCRKRKLERISKLEDKVKILKGENTDLGMIVKTLKDQVFHLKKEVIDHVESGCSIPAIYSSGSLLQAK